MHIPKHINYFIQYSADGMNGNGKPRNHKDDGRKNDQTDSEALKMLNAMWRVSAGCDLQRFGLKINIAVRQRLKGNRGKTYDWRRKDMFLTQGGRNECAQRATHPWMLSVKTTCGVDICDSELQSCLHVRGACQVGHRRADNVGVCGVICAQINMVPTRPP